MLESFPFSCTRLQVAAVSLRHLRIAEEALTPHGRGQWIIETKRHVGGCGCCLGEVRNNVSAKEEGKRGAYAVNGGVAASKFGE